MRRLPVSLSVDALKWVWRDSPDRTPSTAGAPGVDWVSSSVFSANLFDHIADIRNAVRANTYRFSRLRTSRVVKASGGHRIIAIPTVRDRLVQRALLRHLEGDARFVATSSISYGFAKGRTLADAQRRALELRRDRPWMLQADIIRFFDRIPRPVVKALIQHRVRTKVVAELLCAAVDCELDVPDAGREGIQRGLGLRQGMPVSPVLSNLLLKGFDDTLAKKGIHAIRYADDIAIFGANRQECIAALDVAREALSKLSLEVPELAEGGKTKLSNPTDAALFLGVEIRRFSGGYRLCAPTKRLNDIEAQMAEMASLASCVTERKALPQVVRALDSFVVGHTASMAVLEDGGEFRARVEARKQRQLQRLLEELLGKDAVANLDDTRRAVLGLREFP